MPTEWRGRVAVGVAVATIVAGGWSRDLFLARAAAKEDARAGIRVVRIYAGADGETHAEEAEAKLGAADALGMEQSEQVKAGSTNFVRFPANFHENWHNAHARRYVITLTGRGEIEVSDGKRAVLEPGRVALVEDMTGKGHVSRALTADWTAVFVQLE
jgi:quercetin dioxygenase-like cupin family protein